MNADDGDGWGGRLPPGFRVVLDHRTRVLDDGRFLLGGADGRALRLTARGAQTCAALLRDGIHSRSTRVLARRTLDAGLVHPRPLRCETAPDVTVVVPVRDRTAQLDRCLAATGDHLVLVVDDGSRDPDAVAAICRRHGALLRRRTTSGGPAAARNTALAVVDSDLVAFLDADCVPPPGWIPRLAGHFADPRVTAVAPRIVPVTAAPPGSVRSRFCASRCPLDMGPHPAAVTPGGRLSYVPTAALLMRRAAIAGGFDSDLRYGEDVDLVWRLHDGGQVVRYEPTVEVAHHEPDTWRALLLRRLRYGTSAGPLSRRHRGRLAPARLAPVPALTLLTLLAGRPKLAAGLALGGGVGAARRLRGLGAPVPTAVAVVAAGTASSLRGGARAAMMLAWPAVLALLSRRRLRAAALATLIGPALAEWVERRPALDPVRWVAVSVADDICYGFGVWRGAVTERTVAPLLPAVRR